MDKKEPICLRHHVKQALDGYFACLEGNQPSNLYSMVLREMETSLIHYVLRHTNNNQSTTAEMLGISRGTLRKKIRGLV
jgi:Fis family transcriptional regulator, factor for inversion stimulation protein